MLVPMKEQLATRVAPGGLLVLSGILAPQKDEVLAAYGDFALEAAPAKGEWVRPRFARRVDACVACARRWRSSRRVSARSTSAPRTT